ncbi:MAG: Alanine racemase [Chlamydiales bacterium]|nr:Alanine racemase [Chlamydiales bacterium]MCH9634920.1 Alanine racemase [Chlamydiales bacterium]MCH9703390.1 alanine racemase [Chlamydiota bacterium]
MPSSKLIIDCEALKRRFLQFDKSVMPMVKGNGYGLGAYEMACLYENLGAPFVGVSYAEEAVALRERGFGGAIFVLSCSDLTLASAYELTIAIHSLDQARKLDRLQRRVDVHLQLDLGLNRFGFSRQKLLEALPFIHKSPYLNLEGVMTHLGRDQSEAQRFEEIAKMLPVKWKHLASSKSLAIDPACCNMVRLGYALLDGLKLESYVVALHECEASSPMGYSGKLSGKKRQLAALSIGYHDGLLDSFGWVYIAGQKAEIVPDLYMDFLMVDVTGLAVQIGEPAEIFGPNISIEEMAGSHNPRRLLCCLGPRVEREYVNIRSDLGTGKTHCAL